MLARSFRKLTAEQFYDEYGLRDEKYELVDGEAWLMAGGTISHNLIAVNILTSLRQQLRGTGCLPFGSDMGLRVELTEVRYPDVAVYCDPRDLSADREKQRDMAAPKLIFEVLSPSTEKFDRAVKLELYRGLPSVEAIILIDPIDRRIELHKRLGPEEWHSVRLPSGSDLEIAEPAVRLTHEDMFRTD